MPPIPLPMLIRALRDGPPEHYDPADLQVALWAGEFTAAPAPPRHAQLGWFYDMFFKRPFPPIIMIVTIRQNRMGSVEVDLVSRRTRRYYGNMLAEAQGEHYDPHDSLIYLQDGYQVIEDFYGDMGLTNAEIQDIDHGWTIRKKIHIDLFEHYFGWSNQLDMGT